MEKTQCNLFSNLIHILTVNVTGDKFIEELSVNYLSFIYCIKNYRFFILHMDKSLD